MFDDEIQSHGQIDALCQDKKEEQLENVKSDEEDSVKLLDVDHNNEVNQILNTLVIRDELTDEQLYWNLIKMTLMWT